MHAACGMQKAEKLPTLREKILIKSIQNFVKCLRILDQQKEEFFIEIK